MTERHEKMMNMSEQERKAMRQKIIDRHEKMMNMSKEERQAMFEKRRGKGGRAQ